MTEDVAPEEVPEVKQRPLPEGWRPLSDAEEVEVVLPGGETIRLDSQGRTLCSAKRKDGNRCKSPAISGLKKCRMHVGQSKSARKATQLALANAAQPALAKLIQLMGRADSEAVQLRAADSILDRSGFGRSQVIEGADAKELLFQRLIAEVDAAEIDNELAENSED